MLQAEYIKIKSFDLDFTEEIKIIGAREKILRILKNFSI